MARRVRRPGFKGQNRGEPGVRRLEAELRRGESEGVGFTESPIPDVECVSAAFLSYIPARTRWTSSTSAIISSPSGWDKQPPVPELPDEMISGLAQRYREIYRILTDRDRFD